MEPNSIEEVRAKLWWARTMEMREAERQFVELLVEKIVQAATEAVLKKEKKWQI